MSVRVKICGLTDEAALEAAVAAGVDALGFVLAPSPRQLSLSRARALLRLVPDRIEQGRIERVAVFARATRAELERALALGFDALQAEHGSDWPPLPAGVFALPVLRDGPDLLARAAELPPGPAHAFPSLRGALVVDGPRGGGQGVRADVGRARALAAGRPVVLAGGLDPSNVAAHIRAVRPWAVDTSSGVERVRGRKDPTLVHAFVRAVRAAEGAPRVHQESP
jgi:phosphoribosylanthranilate isomerase